MKRKGFFTANELQTNKQRRISNNPLCGKCGLYKNCKSPKMEPTGKGTEQILYVAEAPGAMEDRKNKQLIGSSGQYLRKIISKLGHNLDNGRKTNANICRPIDNTKSKENIKPTKQQIQCCYPNLKKEIDLFKPHVIIVLGGNALYSLLNHKIDKGADVINKWRGFMIPDYEYNAWICPTFHPSYIDRGTTPEIAEKIFIDDLKCAFNLLDIPLPPKDNLQNSIEVIKHPKQAEAWIHDFLKNEYNLSAFDYETTGLKPQRTEQEICTCAICSDINYAVAFPMFFNNDAFMHQFKKYLKSPKAKKIAANMKFERDWSFTKIGKVNGLYFDTMINAHCLDNRTGITSLTFQNYINFGVESYEKHIKKYLQGKKQEIEKYGANALNDIHKIDLYDLLIYNGMDAITEFRQGLMMMDRMGIEYKDYYAFPFRGIEFCPQYKMMDDLFRKEKRKWEVIW